MPRSAPNLRATTVWSRPAKPVERNTNVLTALPSFTDRRAPLAHQGPLRNTRHQSPLWCYMDMYGGATYDALPPRPAPRAWHTRSCPRSAWHSTHECTESGSLCRTMWLAASRTQDGCHLAHHAHVRARTSRRLRQISGDRPRMRGAVDHHGTMLPIMTHTSA